MNVHVPEGLGWEELQKFFRSLNKNYYAPAAEWLERPAHQWATLGGLGSLGLLHQSISEGMNRVDAPPDPYSDYVETLKQHLDSVNKTGGIVAADTVPTTPSQPKPSAPPVKSTLQIAKQVQKSPENTGKEETKKEENPMTKNSFMDQGLTPLVVGAGGGMLGYLGAKHVINPLLKSKENSILAQLAKGEEAVSGLRSLQKIAPVATTVLGALLLAAVASKMSKDKTQAQMQWMSQRYGPAANAYQYGTNPQDVMSMNDPRGQQANFY